MILIIVILLSITNTVMSTEESPIITNRQQAIDLIVKHNNVTDESQLLIKLHNTITRAQYDAKFRETLDVHPLLVISSLFSRPITGLHIAVLGYSSQLVAPWDPFSCDSGLPGSEECVVYATQELARQGHTVTVYMNPPVNSLWSASLINPRWIHVSQWSNPNNTRRYDLVLMWRRYDMYVGQQRGKIVFSWLHDSPNNVKDNFPPFHGLCVLSQHHYQQLAAIPQLTIIPHTISGNGLLLTQFTEPMSFTNSYSMGYFSNYARGLELLLYIWPTIRKEFPLATLDIYYGRETWGILSQERMNKLVAIIESYKTMGVTERGKVGHIALANAMQNTSVWCYPCTDPGETFCITAVKCQAAGCIPVTTRIGALAETIHKDAPSIDSITNAADLMLYQQLLLQTLKRIRDSDPILLIQERRKYIAYGQQYTWKACIDKWLTLYNQVK